MEHLSKEELIEINRRVVAVNRDPHAVQNAANLDYVVEILPEKYANKPEEEQVIWKSAFLLHFIAAKGHIFAEGNKRTALMATSSFLMKNNYSLRYDGPDFPSLTRLILSVAEGKLSVTQVAKFIQTNLVRVLGPFG